MEYILPHANVVADFAAQVRAIAIVYNVSIGGIVAKPDGNKTVVSISASDNGFFKTIVDDIANYFSD